MRGVLDKDLVQLEVEDIEWSGYEVCAHSRSIHLKVSDRARIIPRAVLSNPECYESRDSLTLILGME